MPKSYTCLVCGEQGHASSSCKSVAIPPEGFYTGGGGGHSHGDDEDDQCQIITYKESCDIVIKSA